MEVQLPVFFQAVSQIPACILITEPEGRIKYVNPRFTQLTGYSLEEVRGKTPRILKSGETPEDVYEKLWDTITQGKTWESEILNRKKSGELYWAHQLIAPVLDAEGNVDHFIAMQQDITERKHTEAELRVMNTRLQVQLGEIERLHDQLWEETISNAKRLETLEAIQEAGRTTTNTLSLDETLLNISEKALYVVGAGEKPEKCFSHIALLENEKLRFVAAYPKEGLPHLQEEVEINLTSSTNLGIAGRATKSRKPEVVPDTTSDPDSVKLVEFARSRLSVPLIFDKQTLGVLIIEHSEPYAFTTEDVKNIEVLAEQAAKAIQNAQLYKSDVFVLMPFAKQYRAFYEDVIKKTIEDMNLTCKRADDFFQSTVIMNDIMRCIIEAGTILADFSGRSPNVFFEVGIAHALGKNVILITQDLQDIPPKLQVIRCHIYKNDLSGAKEFPNILRKAILETRGKDHSIFPKATRAQPDPNLCLALTPSSERGERTYNDLVLDVIKQFTLNCIRTEEIFDSDSVLDQMWNQIVKANIVIADLTDRDPDIFYLAGLAYGLRKRIALMSQRLDDVPFDLKKGSCLIYSLNTYAEGKSAKEKLHQIIKDIITSKI